MSLDKEKQYKETVNISWKFYEIPPVSILGNFFTENPVATKAKIFQRESWNRALNVEF